MTAYLQLTQLEDAVIIYRIVRAPERRVFFIDVGNMPPQRIKSYLESIKNEVKQKRIPNEAGGSDKIDSNYNPLSMTEDYYFAQTANGRGSRVETLSGGENLGSIQDLTYFQNRFLQGLRIPSSYMRGSTDNGSMINDGKVGVAYIEEKEFFNYVKRLQNKLEVTFDKEFKAYIKSANLKIDLNLFKLRLPESENYAKYKQSMIDADMISNFNNVKDVKSLSKRFVLKRFLGLSEEELQTNEILLKQEQNIPEFGLTDGLSDIRMIYDDAWQDAKPKIKVSDKINDYTKETGDMLGDGASDAPPEDAEGEDPNAEDAGSEDTGADDTGAEDVGSDDSGAVPPAPDEGEDVGKTAAAQAEVELASAEEPKAKP